eukprot:15359619-Ditylum_brightwellii.AAC.1
MQRKINDVMAENVKLQKRIEKLNLEMGAIKNKLEYLQTDDGEQQDRPFTTGDCVHYSSNPSLKSHDKVGKIVKITKKCV